MLNFLQPKLKIKFRRKSNHGQTYLYTSDNLMTDDERLPR